MDRENAFGLSMPGNPELWQTHGGEFLYFQLPCSDAEEPDSVACRFIFGVSSVGLIAKARPASPCEVRHGTAPILAGELHMYRPKFCAECSSKIIRLRWHFWTSRKFCERCSPRFLREQVKRVVIAGAAVFLSGMAVGQAARQTAPPVVIQRNQGPGSTSEVGKANGPPQVAANSSSVVSASTTRTEELYTCGARTRKGTPCTRRVHGHVRCWQHLGLPAMLPLEQLRIKTP